MIRSQPIDIDGRFVGVAVNASHHWHLVVVDPALADLHGQTFTTPGEAARVVRLVLARNSATGAAPRRGELQ